MSGYYGRKRNYSSRSNSGAKFGSTFKRSRYGAKGSSKYAKRTRKYVRGLNRIVGNYGRFSGIGGVEMKWFDTVNTGTLAEAGGIIAHTNASINAIKQGTGQNEMLGRKITVKLVEVNISLIKEGIWIAGNAATDETIQKMQTAVHFKVSIVLDTQCNGTVAGITDVFEGTAGSNNVFFGFPKMENSKRFVILRTKYVTINSDGQIVKLDEDDPGSGFTFGYSPKKKHWLKFRIPMSKDFEFAPMAGTERNINEIKSNNILYMVQASLIPGGGSLSYWCGTRLRYTDS